jgi:hypothetical protein
MRVALVDPYLGGSHLAWAEGYARHSCHDVVVLGLPASFWKWRMQGGHVTLAGRIDEAVAAGGLFDVVLATSTTNLPAVLGQARRTLGAVPAVLYMHENQLTYPVSPLDREDLTYAMINWSSMTAADPSIVVVRGAPRLSRPIPRRTPRPPHRRGRRPISSAAGRCRSRADRLVSASAR